MSLENFSRHYYTKVCRGFFERERKRSETVGEKSKLYYQSLVLHHHHHMCVFLTNQLTFNFHYYYIAVRLCLVKKQAFINTLQASARILLRTLWVCFCPLHVVAHECCCCSCVMLLTLLQNHSILPVSHTCTNSFFSYDHKKLIYSDIVATQQPYSRVTKRKDTGKDGFAIL